MINCWPSYFNINPVPPITYWWIRMPLLGTKISIGTHTRNGSTMINTPWHLEINAQELFYFMILPVGGTWSNWSRCLSDSKAWTLHRCPWNFDIWQIRWMLSQEPWQNPPWGGEVPLVTTWNYRCYCFDEKWSWKTRLNGRSQHLYPVAAWVNKLMYKARLIASTWHDVDITILFVVLKDASEEHNVIRRLCGAMYFCLPAPVLDLKK